MELLNPALIIFIRNPVKGKVKKRLAASIGEEKAFEVYRYLLHLTRKTTATFPIKKYLFYSDFIEVNDEWQNNFFVKKLQLQKNDLGLRMQDAFEKVFHEGHNKVVIIGSDVPGLEHKILTDAFDKLKKFDVVLGPAQDGGYYLLGLKKMYPDLFNNKKWGEANVLMKTIEDIRRKDCSFFLLPELIDVDDESDLKVFGQGEMQWL